MRVAQVYLRWVVDSDRFNEWMNPIDYETEDAIAEQESNPGLVIKDGAGARPASAGASPSGPKPMSAAGARWVVPSPCHHFCIDCEANVGVMVPLSCCMTPA